MANKKNRSKNKGCKCGASKGMVCSVQCSKYKIYFGLKNGNDHLKWIGQNGKLNCPALWCRVEHNHLSPIEAAKKVIEKTVFPNPEYMAFYAQTNKVIVYDRQGEPVGELT